MSGAADDAANDGQEWRRLCTKLRPRHQEQHFLRCGVPRDESAPPAVLRPHQAASVSDDAIRGTLLRQFVLFSLGMLFF